MHVIFVPGGIIVLDETMSAWRGLYNVIGGLPHLSVVPRKPEPVGTEMKDAACGDTGVIICIVIEEGKGARDDYDKTIGHTVATSVRLTSSWHASGRTVIGDSWFASVKNCEALREKGLYFIGMVKTAHALYPLDFLVENTPRVTGERLMYEAKLAGSYPVYATSYRFTRDSLKTLVSTCGTSLPKTFTPEQAAALGKDERIEGYADDAPSVLVEYSAFAGRIDQHNKYRQAILAIEKRWKSQTWWHRLYGTLVGIVVVNAYLVWKTLHDDDLTLLQFTNTLAKELCYAQAEEEGQDEPDESHDFADIDSGHDLCPLANHFKMVGESWKQLRCRVCSSKASYFCKRCGIRMPLCGPGTGRTCAAQHRATPTVHAPSYKVSKAGVRLSPRKRGAASEPESAQPRRLSMAATAASTTSKRKASAAKSNQTVPKRARAPVRK